MSPRRINPVYRSFALSAQNPKPVLPRTEGPAMKAFAAVGGFIWLICGLAGAWMMGDVHWKPIAKGPITLAKAFNDDPVSYPGSN